MQNSTGADNENSNTEPTTTNPTTSNPETTQNHLERENTKTKADGELSNPETRRSNPSRAMLGDPTTTPVQYIRTNNFANDWNTAQQSNYCNASQIPDNCSDKQFLCCFCLLFVCFVLIFVLIICQIFS